MLIKKEYYLDLIKDYKNELKPEDKFIFKYEIDQVNKLELFIKEASEKLNSKIYNCSMGDNDYLQRFIYGIYNSMAVVTNSFHGVIFSLIFNKPFVAFNLNTRGNERFNTLRDVYCLGSRIFDTNEIPDISLITIPLEINRTKIDELINKSNVFLKKNLNIS